MQPVIEAGRLVLTPVSASDFPDMGRILRDPQVRHFLFDGEILADDVLQDYIHHSRITAAHGLGLWMARKEGLLVGIAGLKPVDNADAIGLADLAGMPEIVIGLLPAFWGRGHAGSAVDALLRHAFEALKCPVVAGIADAPNAASRRMLVRSGFRPVATGCGKIHPLIGYALSASDWRPRA